MSDTNYKNVGAFNNQPANINFLRTNQARFLIKKLPNTNYFVQKCEIPGMSLATVWQGTPLQQLPLSGMTLNFDELSITFAVDEDLKNYFEIFNWMNNLASVKTQSQYAGIKSENIDVNPNGGIWSDATLHLLTNQSNANVALIFRDAFPVFLSKVPLDTTSKDAAIVTATALFRYAYIDIG